MTVPFVSGKPALPVALVACLSVFQPRPARGQEPGPNLNEIQAVVRISRLLIDDVASRKEVVAAIPYQAKVLGFRTQGVIDGLGHLTVDLSSVDREGSFIINGQGSAQTNVRGVRGPVAATGTAWGPFSTRTVVRFDGRKFLLAETTPWSEVHGELNCVEGRRGGPVGRAGGRLLRPIGLHMLPNAEREATPIANAYLKTYVNELAEEIIVKLNRTTPVEQSLNRLFPQSRDWVFRLSTDPRFIQSAYGPRGSAVTVLPENPGGFKDTRLELWLRSTTEEARALEALTKRPLAQQLVHRYLEATLPELAALTEERRVTSVGTWLVISIGAPKAK